MEFKIRSYGRTELAQAYCPTMNPNAAYRKLQMWISYNQELQACLAALGLNPKTRTYTPAQVQAIVKYIGEP